MAENKQYWKGLEELNNDPEFIANSQNEFPEELPLNDNDASTSSRRDFLKVMGFSVAAVSLAACETPVKKAIPYINKPEIVDPGKPNYYASTYAIGSLYNSIIVKTREGRPIKIEGNPASSISQGGVSGYVQASVLNLYDSSRLTSFTKEGKSIDKATADAELKKSLKSAKNFKVVTESIISPTSRKLLNEFCAAYNADLVVYDPISADGILKANGGVIPDYRFGKANVVVSFAADFLSTWLSSVEYSKDYSKKRKVDNDHKTMSRHYQFESNMSLTGANADVRIPIKASEQGKYILALYNEVASLKGASKLETSGISNDEIKNAAKDLSVAGAHGLVVCDSNDINVQVLVKGLNELLANTGTTVSFKNALATHQGDDKKMLDFVVELEKDKVDAVLFYKCNPAYNYPKSRVFTQKLASVGVSVSISDRKEETSSLCQYILTDYNFLESWGDAEPKKGIYSLIQPTISPVFPNTRQAEDSLLALLGSVDTYYDYLVSSWKLNMFTIASGELSFEAWWNTTLQSGVFAPGKLVALTTPKHVEHADSAVIAAAIADTVSVEGTEDEELVEAVVEETPVTKLSLSGSAQKIANTPSIKGFELLLYASSAMYDGSSANNAWLQEMPDPISKVTWDNYLSISIADAKSVLISGKELKDGDKVKVLVAERTMVEVPVLVQPGQARGTVGLALGYGRKEGGKLLTTAKKLNGPNTETPEAIGVDAYPFIDVNASGSRVYFCGGAQFSDLNMTYPLGRTQTAQTLAGRNTSSSGIVREATLATFKSNPTSIVERVQYHTSEGQKYGEEIDLWAAPNKDGGEIKTHEYHNHHWGMVIDLNSCTGCSACHISCQVENNIPVVGKDEVVRKRDMHWMRIDRYYSNKDGDQADSFKTLETAAQNPEVVFQPMMCQHCNHAPCETVCPVAATSHSSEGLNQMAYNRCIGTRYCANNCPYKVRRFNWFNFSDSTSRNREFNLVNYAMNDDLGKMVLNPDVTVRARGTMEKCSMCVQRIQLGKLDAKLEKRPVKDQEIKVACASVCPTDAITFGDMNDPESNISKVLNKKNTDRKYHVLEELNVKPNISYLAKIRNKA